jgi:putative addiction module killer protein
MGEVRPQPIDMYVTSKGWVPFEAWLSGLRDARAQARIGVRLDRLRLGNPGDVHPVGARVSELRSDYGPGYRVYFAQSAPATLLLLYGGDNSTQAANIRKAKYYWAAYQRRTRA